MGELSRDMVMTLVRYAVIAWCFKHGVTDTDVMTAYANLFVGGATVLWGLSASGYFVRFKDWLKSFKGE